MGIALDKLPGIVERFPGGSVAVTQLDQAINLARSNSLWPLMFGTKCCAIEMLMATGAAHHDLARFGAEVARASVRQADLMVIAGAIVKKMAPRMRLLYEQMAEPRYVIATGSCTIAGGPFIYHSYTTIRGADEIIPVDVYVPGCPPRPEALFYGILTLQKMIREGESLRHPGERRRPVMSALPEGTTMEMIRDEMRELLEGDANVNIKQAQADGAHWADELKDF